MWLTARFKCVDDWCGAMWCPLDGLSETHRETCVASCRRPKSALLPPLPNRSRFGLLLHVLDGYRETLPVWCALRLVPLVFVRPGELREAEWAGIDLEGGKWCYTVTKTGTPQMSSSHRSSYFKHLQHLVSVMVDDLHSQLARFWLVERPAHRVVQTAPGGFVDLCP